MTPAWEIVAMSVHIDSSIGSIVDTEIRNQGEQIFFFQERDQVSALKCQYAYFPINQTIFVSPSSLSCLSTSLPSYASCTSSIASPTSIQWSLHEGIGDTLHSVQYTIPETMKPPKKLTL